MVKRHVLHTTRRPAGEGANIDRRLVPYTRDAMRTKSRIKFHCFHPRAAEGRRPEGVGANLDRRLVPYHGKYKRIQSRIEFIYLYIQLFQLRLSPEQSGKVEYERERLAGNR